MKSFKIFQSQYWLLLPLVLVYGCMAILPVGTIFSLSIENGIDSYEQVLTSRVFSRVLDNTLTIGTATTVLTVALGYLLAAGLWKSGTKMRIVLFGFILLPFWSAVLIKNFSWAVLLQDNGMVNTFLLWTGVIAEPLHMLHTRFAVLVGMVHYTLPFAVFPIFSCMIAIDDRLERAARSLGAPTRSVLWLVILPLTLPGVYAAGLLVLIITIGFYITPVVLGSPRDMMIANMVQYYAHEMIDFGAASALAMLILLVVGFLIAIYQMLPKEGQHGGI